MNKENLNQDFYAVVNKDWFATAKIRPDRFGTGAFYEIYDRLEDTLKEIANKWAEDEKSIPADPKLKEFVKYYKMNKDFETKTKLGIRPLLPMFNELEKLNSFEDVFAKYDDLTHKGIYMPIDFGVSTDFKDSEIENLYVSHPELIFSIKTKYNDKEKIQVLIDKYSEIAQYFLIQAGKTEKEAKRIVELSLEWDQKLLPLAMDPEYSAVYTQLYNPRSASEMKKYSDLIDFSAIAKKLVGQEAKEFIITYPYFFENVSKLISKETFEAYKSRMLIDFLLSNATLLSDELRYKYGELTRLINGNSQDPTPERHALISSIAKFRMVVGEYYGKTYFGADAKANVEHLIKSMISIYKQRLTNNTWLSKQTIAMAIKKLDTLKMFVGYPEYIQEYYNDFKVKTYAEGSNLFENSLNFKIIVSKYGFSKYLKTKDTNLWGMSPADVNAYYSPTENKIVFPAGILQAPFYSINQTSSQNFGGIGAVIAHEISHGFDNNGANFDEKGNMVNWWTDEDRANFDKKAQGIIEQFDGVETEFGKCNGKLVVSENIADNGGVACAYEAAKLEKDFNAKEFMINFATIWRTIYVPEFAKNLLLADVHAPTKLRANIQISNLDDFYTEFDVKEGDKMYMAPEKRVKIW